MCPHLKPCQQLWTELDIHPGQLYNARTRTMFS